MSANKSGRNNFIIKAFKKGTVLIVPFLLFFIAVSYFAFWGFEYMVADSVYYKTIFNDSIVDLTENEPILNQQITGLAPAVRYGSQWATLNVEGWERQGIPVFSGDEYSILKRGGGHWLNSRFCGENGKIVISAHVNSYFREIEETKIGDMVTMNTVFGDGEVYGYKVVDIVIFDQTDASLIAPEDGKETLVMYTCYPLKNNGKKRVQRIALVCEKVYGRMWAEK